MGDRNPRSPFLSPSHAAVWPPSIRDSGSGRLDSLTRFELGAQALWGFVQ